MIGVTKLDVPLFVIVEENQNGMPASIIIDARTHEEARAHLRYLRGRAKEGKKYTAYRRSEEV